MPITHIDIVTVLGGIFALVVFMLGYWRGHYRAYAECCDCCTCQTCTDRDGPDLDEWEDEPPVFSRPATPLGERHTIVLEPGPTIYPALAELAGEVMDEPESHPDATTSPWLRLQLVDWERRYPIPVGAP